MEVHDRLVQDVGAAAYADDELRPLLLDAPTVMGVENIEVDTLNIRIVARTLPGTLDRHQRAEVDGAEWLPLEEAPARLAYSGEKEMARAALSKVAQEG